MHEPKNPHPIHDPDAMVWQADGGWIGYLRAHPSYRTQGDDLEHLREHLRDLDSDLTTGRSASVTEIDGIVHSHPEIMGGEPVFVGTRVPVRALVDHLEEGDSVDRFVDAYPTVSREQVDALIGARPLHKNSPHG